MPFPTRLLK
ncbi:hypothetical protein VCHENC02_3298A, partial [Vibrio harveyi]